MSMSYSGKYSRLSSEEQGFDSLHRRQARPLVEALHAKHWFNSRRIHSMGPTPGVRHFPRKETTLRGFHTRSRFMSVSYSGQYSRLSNGQHGFDSRHRYQPQPTQSVLAHGRGSYPRIGWFDSIDCDERGAPPLEALHATFKERSRCHRRRREHRGFGTRA